MYSTYKNMNGGTNLQCNKYPVKPSKSKAHLLYLLPALSNIYHKTNPPFQESYYIPV